MKLFSDKKRPFWMGPYPLERLRRQQGKADLGLVPPMQALRFQREDDVSLVNAMQRYMAMLDAIRDGMVVKEQATIPDDLQERARHFKSFGYYQDASQAGICELGSGMFLEEPVENPDIDALSEMLRTQQTKTLAAGIDVVMAELKESMSAPSKEAGHHNHAIVYLYEYPRDPKADESGCEWIQDSQAERAALRAAETAVIIANYIRLLGYEARAHGASCSDVDLNKVAVAAGLALVEEGDDGAVISNPYLGERFGIAVITTTLPLAPDQALDERQPTARWQSHGPAWWTGYGSAKNHFNHEPFKTRLFKQGQYPFERSKKVEQPTTLIDEPRIPRVPKRTDMFARAIFGDMGERVQSGAKNGKYVSKSPTSFAARKPLAAFVLLQDGPVAQQISMTTLDEQKNADNIKAALYFMGADAVGVSRCPEWAYYSHDAVGEPLEAYHSNAISVIIDQGRETMEGASGDDWIACSQSMRAYLRFSLLGGIIGDQIRNLGYEARVHSVMDGEVLQPPLLLLSGLGEVSRIGEVILNPYLGPRLKSGVITTNMPLAHDQPIDFGLQKFCEQCNKCARECPSGAITAGPKTMFNGYEIWKSDSQKCTTYRITQAAGAMCGRCMKTCPWNLEGLFAEAPFRWLATNMPAAAKSLAALDDKLGNGRINPVKKWWWDLEMNETGGYHPSKHGAEQRELQPELKLKGEDQTLAVYPANLAPPPYPFPFKMDREAGIEAYQNMLDPQTYQQRLEAGEVDKLAHEYQLPSGDAPVLRLQISDVKQMTSTITRYELSSPDGQPLPEFEAGAHIDVVVAPEFLRQYSLSGDPADRSKYQIAVLYEKDGRGGSALMHRIFDKGRKVFVSRPVNHFPLVESAKRSLLMAGGIGITPLIAMAHQLHAQQANFVLHYSFSSRDEAAFLQELEQIAWSGNVHLHISNEGSRAKLDEILSAYREADHLYTCGPDRYMNSVLETAAAHGWPEDAMHREYFSVPEVPEYENHEFTLSLARSGGEVNVLAEQSAAEALLEAGYPINLKCSDGLCGVCQCGLLKGKVEHRDFVLSKAQQEDSIILCQSRAAEAGETIEIDL